jgi:RimJ/RimL family protein N-acetyltransferase
MGSALSSFPRLLPVETDNPSSIRVLQKLGFEHVAEFDEDWPEAKGGGTRRNFRLEKVVS